MPDPHDPGPNRPSLFFEPPEEDDSNYQAMQTILPGKFSPPPPPEPPGGRPPASGPPPAPRPAADDTPPFRPQQRPPMALLCVLHDGDAGGEWLPLRADRAVIARGEGDVRIPHDGQVSGRQHAEIVRTRTDTGYRWHLADLGSRNGTFVRVAKLPLAPGTEVMVGRTRYRFETAAPAVVPSAAPPPANAGFATMLPGSATSWPSPAAAAPTFVELTPAGDGPRVQLIRDEYWLGRDPDLCAIVPRDPFVSPRHARIVRGEQGRWRVENNRSRNGVWLRLAQPLAVEGTCQFMIGEQRFILKVLS